MPSPYFRISLILIAVVVLFVDSTDILADSYDLDGTRHVPLNNSLLTQKKIGTINLTPLDTYFSLKVGNVAILNKVLVDGFISDAQKNDIVQRVYVGKIDSKTDEEKFALFDNTKNDILSLKVDGNIGAEKLCDSDGGSCVETDRIREFLNSERDCPEGQILVAKDDPKTISILLVRDMRDGSGLYSGNSYKVENEEWYINGEEWNQNYCVPVCPFSSKISIVDDRCESSGEFGQYEPTFRFKISSPINSFEEYKELCNDYAALNNLIFNRSTPMVKLLRIYNDNSRQVMLNNVFDAVSYNGPSGWWPTMLVEVDFKDVFDDWRPAQWGDWRVGVGIVPYSNTAFYSPITGLIGRSFAVPESPVKNQRYQYLAETITTTDNLYAACTRAQLNYGCGNAMCLYDNSTFGACIDDKPWDLYSDGYLTTGNWWSPYCGNNFRW